jgi:hypothetical protein
MTTEPVTESIRVKDPSPLAVTTHPLAGLTDPSATESEHKSQRLRRTTEFHFHDMRKNSTGLGGHLRDRAEDKERPRLRHGYVERIEARCKGPRRKGLAPLR